MLALVGACRHPDLVLEGPRSPTRALGPVLAVPAPPPGCPDAIQVNTIFPSSTSANGVCTNFADGDTERRTWDGRQRWARWSFPSPQPLTEVVVDPDGTVTRLSPREIGGTDQVIQAAGRAEHFVMTGMPDQNDMKAGAGM